MEANKVRRSNFTWSVAQEAGAGDCEMIYASALKQQNRGLTQARVLQATNSARLVWLDRALVTSASSFALPVRRNSIGRFGALIGLIQHTPVHFDENRKPNFF